MYLKYKRIQVNYIFYSKTDGIEIRFSKKSILNSSNNNVNNTPESHSDSIEIYCICS